MFTMRIKVDRRWKWCARPLTGMLLFCGVMLPGHDFALAQIPQMIRYQGTLTDATGVLMDGNYNLTFRFYDAATAGNKVWEETQNTVPVSRGAFSVMLGSVTALNLKFDQDCWLAISVNGGVELSPRHRVASVPNAYLAQKAEGLVEHSVRAFNNANVMIANSTATILPFDQTRWDTDQMHDDTLNNSRLTCKVPGKYFIFAHVTFESNPTGYRRMEIALNGVRGIAQAVAPPIAGPNVSLVLDTVYDLAVNDYVEVNVVQTSGGSLTVNYIGNESPELGMVKIS